MIIDISYQKATAILKKMDTNMKEVRRTSCGGYCEHRLFGTGAKIKYEPFNKSWYIRTYGCNIDGIL